jgi:metal-sulfur cluster biosynthetic enzyme
MPGVKDVDVEIVWSPPWDPKTMASDEVKMMLGIW